VKLTFLGTSAATSCPLPFCRCPVCAQARRNGGPDYRKRSSLLINEDLLIDLGPDVMSASFQYGVSIDRVRYCLQTHSHSDHFDAGHMITRIPEYDSVAVPPLRLFASEACLSHMSIKLQRESGGPGLTGPELREALHMDLCAVEPYTPYRAGSYTIVAFPSEHDPADGSMLYSVKEEGKTIFYGTDTVAFPEVVWAAFRRLGLCFDVVILDHTYGPGTGGGDHLNADQFIAHRKRFQREGLLADGARVIATHISHTGNPAHAELAAYGRRNGYEIAYDGLAIEI
jgi:phosphoribosyl 1,2-cyclic phosphate phosphodiesterase